jgi:hypothetical protein
MKAKWALLLAACAFGHASATETPEIWVDMSSAKDGSVLVSTNSVRGTGNMRTVTALLVSPKVLREVRFENDCGKSRYRIVGQANWSTDDPEGVRRICTGNFGGLSRFDKSDIDRIKRVQSGGPVYTGNEAIAGFAMMLTGNSEGYWLKSCRSELRSSQRECETYVTGIWETARASKTICGKQADQSEMLSGFRKELGIMSSGELRRPRYDIVMAYLKTAYPCP